jgi:hypothetical protein
VLYLASVAQVLSQKGEGGNKGFLNPDKLFFRECPARPRKNRVTQINPTTRKVAPCLTKSWLRAFALDSRTYAKDLENRVWAIQVFIATW